MALFAMWREDVVRAAPDAAARDVLDASHIVAERTVATAIDTPAGRWRLTTQACTSRFYDSAAQLWLGEGEACVIHGLVWQMAGATARLLDAAAVAALLDRPGRATTALCGEYAVLRLHRCGTLEAFGDPAGLHQLFHPEDGGAIVANRARFVAVLAGAARPDDEAGLWLAAIGYRAGPHSGWGAVRQLGQGARLTARDGRVSIETPALQLPRRRGFDEGLLEEGIGQAAAAIRLAAGDGPLDLPVTGGKDSRAVLALALAAGLGDRLTLFTRGLPDHPDVVAGARIAEALGLPHRREAPQAAGDLAAPALLRRLAVVAWQTDGGMGGWDNLAATTPARAVNVSGHLGELLKAYAKRPPGDVTDPATLVRLQGPFDPLNLLRPAAARQLIDRLAAEMAKAKRAGAAAEDLPDLFYWRHRVPNWLGGIRGVQAFTCQPVLPLGVPALLGLAFAMTAAERAAELAHYEIVRRTAPALLALPFAHQHWSTALPDAPRVASLVAPADLPLFGNWQWSVNRPGVRAALDRLFAADVPLWDGLDRDRLREQLRARRCDMDDAISLLGIATAVLHQSGRIERLRLGDGAPPAEPAWLPACLSPPVAIEGHLDGVLAGGTVRDGMLLPHRGPVQVHGWLRAPAWPGAAVRATLLADGRVVGDAVADRPRADLAAAGMGDGRHGFTVAVDPALLPPGTVLTAASTEEGGGPAGGRLTVAS